ncbi:hypothetical protein F5050DRAFT_1750043, partial [Lentinula boryana]
IEVSWAAGCLIFRGLLTFSFNFNLQVVHVTISQTLYVHFKANFQVGVHFFLPFSTSIIYASVDDLRCAFSFCMMKYPIQLSLS